LKNKKFIADQGGERLDLFISRHIHNISRTKIQHSIKAGLITVNGQKEPSRYRVEIGDEIFIEEIMINSEPQELVPKKLELDILFEDEHIIVINKAPDVTVHPGAGNFENTLVNGLIYKFQNLSDVNGALRPGIVHRLDKDTSGVILVAKNNQSHRLLAEQFEQRRVKKSYIGINWGIWESPDGRIETNIGRQRNDPTKYAVTAKGKVAITNYQVLKRGNYLSVVNFLPETGRTHQIRVHSSYQNHPIFGDDKYGGGLNRCQGFLPEISHTLKANLHQINRHVLHADRLVIKHPVEGKEIVFTAPVPSDIQNLVENPL
jgi:23S rRNA pseudouridine1911/1915/1917 synthase